MAQNTDPETNTYTSSSQELHALLSRVGTLIQMSLDMAKVGVDVQQRIPSILAHHVDDAIAGIPSLVAAQVTAQVAAAAGTAAADILPDFVEGIVITPDALDLLNPAGSGDDCYWHVVLVGREPGIYQSVTTSDELVKGVPSARRRRKSSRLEALTYYRVNYDAGKVKKWVDITPAVMAATPAAAASSSTAPSAYGFGKVSTMIIPFMNMRTFPPS
ncbi:hypothetical protein C8J57DRAFT_1230159 [Mycena rebaudengoi]|nr:hypothetical protein C8J57DRAFT_1230159 [Mycena rebaudengoi]